MYRRRNTRAKKATKARRYRRKAYRKRSGWSKKIFTESFQASDLKINQDGTTVAGGGLPAQQYSANIESLPTPTINAYKQLYSKYRILKLSWIIIPSFGQAEPNQAEFNLGTATIADTNVRLHFKRFWSNSATVPTSEIEMLEMNGVKTLMFNGGKPLRFSMRYPTTFDNLQIITGGGATSFGVLNQKNRWCSFDEESAPAHGELNLFLATNGNGNILAQGQKVATVLCKITFEVAGAR